MLTFAEFHFKSYLYQEDTGLLTLTYAFKDGPELTESLQFPLPGRVLSEKERGALDSAFRLIFLLSGVSYYKAAIPPKLICQAFPLDQTLAAFCEKAYRSGLAEFAYRNQVRLDFQFQTVAEAQPYPVQLDLPKKALVLVGGGKDSIVSMEMLRKAQIEQTLLVVSSETIPTPIAQTIETSKLPFLHVKRTLSPVINTLNEQGALNGHIPITAIISSIAIACAILHGHEAVVLSNESSASEPNISTAGQEVNHQYSKSIGFERDFIKIVQQNISPNIRYFSLLRPLTETAIAQRFAQYPAYFNVFRSCNTAFKQDKRKRHTKWCCDCPKCRFVFLALAPFISKGKLTQIFGQNLLDERKQLDGYKALCGLDSNKPFECVGEIAESATLLRYLAQQPQWQDDAVIKALNAPLAERIPQPTEAFQRLQALRAEHFLPDDYFRILRDA